MNNENQMKRLFTGLQSSGDLHIGNYFGALKPFVDMYEGYESFLMIADYHALTSVRDPEVMRQNTINVVKDYIAAGVDTNKAVIFKQSDNPDHTEMAWIFNCLVTVPFLMQAHSYKDKVAKGIEASAGLFTYPMLMASDIALYNADIVPVGEDQRQHLEYTREAVGKFNRAYGETLKEPTEKIFEAVGVIPGIDGQKMSKSYKNTIPLFGTSEEIEKAVMSIVTDSSGELPKNVYAIHKLFRSKEELDTLYEENKGKYKVLKDALVADIEAMVSPMRERRDSITDADVQNILKDGLERARAVSQSTLAEVRQKIGVTI